MSSSFVLLRILPTLSSPYRHWDGLREESKTVIQDGRPRYFPMSPSDVRVELIILSVNGENVKGKGEFLWVVE